ncbi:MAG: conserved membrane protein of unknown function [Candidatus Thorarchaeota archaeon]|nr:MAG: conserved membrane protein of unknown function [Candidatus Thorarchaeota archaeon]
MADKRRKKYKSASNYMFSGLAKSPGVIFGALVLTVISSVLVLFPNVLLGEAIDVLDTVGLGEEFNTIILTIFVIGVTYLVMYFIVGYSWAVVTLRWERDARQEFFEILQDNSMAFHDEIDSKKLLSVAMQDINWVRFSLNPALRNLVFALASFGITSILLIQIDFTIIVNPPFTILGFPLHVFSLTMLLGSPIYLYFAYRYANTIEPVRREKSEQMEELTSVSQGVFRGIEVVRAFGAEDVEKKRFEDVSKTYEKLVAKEGRLAAFYIPALILIGMTTVAFFYGSYAVLEGYITVGKMIEVLSLLITISGFNFMLPRMLLVLRGGYVNARRIVDILNWEDPLVEPKKESEQIDWTGEIVFDNVSFTYNNGGDNVHYALKDFSIRIPGGSRVALIGGPGGGKSTILKLLLRFYDPTEGCVSVGGTDIRQIRTETVRDNVGLVEQDIFLFRMSIKDNIAFGREEATDEEIALAAQRAQAEEFILDLEEEYDARIGERGMTLSGGQRQRLAIARALIQDPKILLLDDSVSAVDAQTEFMMRKALSEVMMGRTSITVTQRLRTLLESDLVIIVDKGKLIASGCHEDLLRTSKHYRQIFRRLPGAEQVLETVAYEGDIA